MRASRNSSTDGGLLGRTSAEFVAESNETTRAKRSEVRNAYECWKGRNLVDVECKMGEQNGGHDILSQSLGLASVSERLCEQFRHGLCAARIPSSTTYQTKASLMRSELVSKRRRAVVVQR